MSGLIRMALLTALLIAQSFAAASCGGGSSVVPSVSDETSIALQESAAPVEEPSTVEVGGGQPNETPASPENSGPAKGPDASLADPEAAQQPETPADNEPFMIVALPDTQHTTIDYPDIFNAQMQWIADNRDSENIAMVFHEGDVSHYNNPDGWVNANIGFAILDGVVPYIVAVGNHDMESLQTKDTTYFNECFSLSRFADDETFGGSYPEGKMDNSYRLFSAGGVDWLALSIIYLPTAADLYWASEVVEAHPDRRAIVVTHAFIDQDIEIGRDAQKLWNNFLSKHSNITLVLNGHYTDGTYGRLQLAGDNGNAVYGLFANYQKSPFGGSGYMRLMTIDSTAGTISVKTFSPWNNAYKTDDGDQFELTGLDLTALQ